MARKKRRTVNDVMDQCSTKYNTHTGKAAAAQKCCRNESKRTTKLLLEKDFGRGCGSDERHTCKGSELVHGVAFLLLWSQVRRGARKQRGLER